jgi:hypothetical protein
MSGKLKKTTTRRKIKRNKMGTENKKKRRQGVPPFKIHQD